MPSAYRLAPTCIALVFASASASIAFTQRIPGKVVRPDTYEGSKALQDKAQRESEAARKNAQQQSDAFNQQFNQNMNDSLAGQQQGAEAGTGARRSALSRLTGVAKARAAPAGAESADWQPLDPSAGGARQPAGSVRGNGGDDEGWAVRRAVRRRDV